MSILVLGTVALDTVKTPFGSRTAMLGGSAAHFAMSARLFSAVHLVAIVGEDFPRSHIAFLMRKGVCLHSLMVTTGKSFQWSGEYKGDLNAALTLSTELGVLTQFVPQVTERQRAISTVFLANVDPEIQMQLLSHMQRPRLIGLDSMNYWIHNKKRHLLKLLKSVHIFVANDQEARDLSGETNLIKAARCLKSFGPPMVLIKKGEHGVTFYCDSFIFSLPAYPTEDVVDPTGAGDTFAGGFMGYLAKAGKTTQAAIKRGLMYGTVAASFNVEGFGMEKTGRLTLQQLERRLAQFRKCIAVA